MPPGEPGQSLSRSRQQHTRNRHVEWGAGCMQEPSMYPSIYSTDATQGFGHGRHGAGVESDHQARMQCFGASVVPNTGAAM